MLSKSLFIYCGGETVKLGWIYCLSCLFL